jgi:hypothetical protein
MGLTNGPSIVWSRTLFEPREILCNTKKNVVELRSCFNDVLARMEPDEKIQTEIDECAMLYEDQQGPIFSNVMALQ